MTVILVLLGVVALVMLVLLRNRRVQKRANRRLNAIASLTSSINTLGFCAAHLQAETPDEKRQLAFIFEHLRIAKAQASYATQLVHGELSNITRPGELEWALGASRLALTFADRRLVDFCDT